MADLYMPLIRLNLRLPYSRHGTSFHFIGDSILYFNNIGKYLQLFVKSSWTVDSTISSFLIEDYNVELFLALVAMRFDEVAARGEYIVFCKEKCVGPFSRLTNENWNRNTLLKVTDVVGDNYVFSKLNLELGFKDVVWKQDSSNLREVFRKPTSEELIFHFTKNPIEEFFVNDLQKKILISLFDEIYLKKEQVFNSQNQNKLSPESYYLLRRSCSSKSHHRILDDLFGRDANFDILLSSPNTEIFW